MRKKLLLLNLLFLLSMACSIPFLGSQEPELTPVSPSDTPSPTIDAVILSNTPSITPTEQIQQEPPPIQTRLTEKQIAEENSAPKYRIEVKYPYLEDVPRSAIFNQGIENFVLPGMEQFKNDVENLEGEWRQVESFYGIHYDIVYQSADLLSILFTVEFFMAGAAHPGTDMHSENYDIARGQFISLPDLFLPGSDFLEIISRYCIEELNNEGLLGWEDGAEPILSNYDVWNVQPEHLLITFPTYQVAAGAAGTLQVSVPIEILREVIRPDGLLAAFLQ